jgi:hypothetical protein
MPSPRTNVLVLAVLALAGATGAGAQVTTREVNSAVVKDPTLFTRPPIASVTLSASQRTGSIEGGQAGVAFRRVSLPPNSNNVQFNWGENSVAEVQGIQLANGIYSVQFSFVQVSNPGDVAIKEKGLVIATCALQQQLNADGSQRCEATLDVADGKLFVTMELAGSNLVSVSQVTVNRYR